MLYVKHSVRVFEYACAYTALSVNVLRHMRLSHSNCTIADTQLPMCAEAAHVQIVEVSKVRVVELVLYLIFCHASTDSVEQL
jgi:hypothetical protein